MINTTVEIDTMKEFKAYWDKGYTESLEDVCGLLGVKARKAETLLKNVPRVIVSEALDYRLKHKGRKKPGNRYFNGVQVVQHLLRHDLLRVYFYDPKELYIFEGKYNKKEIPVSKHYMLAQLSATHMLLRVSNIIKDIVLEDKGYSFCTYDSNMNMLFMNEADDIKQEHEIVNKSDIVRYTRTIQHNFYVKFVIGEPGKRGNVKYFQSIRTVEVNNLGETIDRWIKEYKAYCKE